MSAWPTVLPIILGGIATLAIYSFLVKENPFYRFFEHLYIGIATGFGIVFGIQRFLWPEFFRPMLGYDREVFANGEYDRPWREWYLFFLIPFAFGMLYYFIYSNKRQWLSRVVIAWSLGVSGGFAVRGFFAQYMPQIIGSFKPLVAVQTVERSLLINFPGLADRLPQNAQISKGRIELYRIGPSYARVTYTNKEGGLESIEGRVTGLDEDPKTGSITLDVAGKEQTISNAEVVQRVDVASPKDVPDAYEGYGGEHQYLAYRTLRAWDPGKTDFEYRRHPAETGPGTREAVLTALRTPDPAQRAKAVEDALGARLGPADTETVLGVNAGDAAQVGAAADVLLRWHADDFAPSAESNTGMTLLVRQSVNVKDPYRNEQWKAGVRESIGFKVSELSPETLRAWYDRPEADFGVIMQRKAGAGGSYLHRFASAQNPDVAHRPRLVVEYRMPGDDKPKELVLQNGVDGYDSTANAVVVSGVDQPTPAGPEFLLGATARKPNGALSLDFWSSSGILANWIFVVTLICVMTYFLFSFEHAKPGIYQASLAGRWLMMLCFGAFFGSTIMARMALLVERMQFIIEKWIPTLFGQG